MKLDRITASILYLFILALVLPLSENADAGTVTPYKKGAKLFASSDPDKNTIYGHYEISVFENGKWRSAGKLKFGKHFKEKRIEYSRLPNKNGPVKIRLTQRGGGGAHIDSITFGGASPELIDGKKGIDLKKVSKTDYDVIDAYNKTVELQFPAGIENATIAVTARVEGERISEEPFKFPVVNTYTEIDENSSFYIYDLGSNKGRLSLKGKTEELAGHEPLFKAKSTPGSGHPEGYTYGYVMNDDENLYGVIDFTVDDTKDGDKDYVKVFVKTKDGVKEFKVSEENRVWGEHHFLYNDKVSYQHKYYEFKIPLKEIGAGKDTEKVLLAFAAYGTAAIIAPDPLNIGNVDIGLTDAGVVTFDNTGGATDNWQICGISVAGGDAAMFGITDPNGNCAVNDVVNMGNACTFNATFSPTSAGAKTTTLNVTYDNEFDVCGAPFGPLTLTLDGVGVAATPIYHTLVVYETGAYPAGMGRVYSVPYGINCFGDFNGNRLGICSAEFLEGTEVTLYAQTMFDLIFHRWEGDCEDVWRGDPCVLYMDEYKEVPVRFYPPEPEDPPVDPSVDPPVDPPVEVNNPPYWLADPRSNGWLVNPQNRPIMGDVFFIWWKLTDPDDDFISYHILFCDDTGACVPRRATPRLSGQKPDRQKSDSMYAVDIGALGGVLIFGFMLGGGLRTRGGRALLFALFFMMTSLGAEDGDGDCNEEAEGCGNPAFCGDSDHINTCRDYLGNNEEGRLQQCRLVTGLAAGAYYWKVVASDGRGGIAESAIANFTIVDWQ